MLERQLVFGRPPNPYRSVEIAQMQTAVPERDPRVPKRRSTPAADDRAPAKSWQAQG